MTVDQIKEAKRLVQEKISYELDLLEKQTGLVIAGFGGYRLEDVSDRATRAFAVQIELRLPL